MVGEHDLCGSTWDFVAKLQGAVGMEGKEPLQLSAYITLRMLLFRCITVKICLRAAKSTTGWDTEQA